MNPRLAAIISTVGNPFVLFPVVVSYLTINEYGYEQARPIILSVCCIFVVLSVFLLVRRLTGKITNLDVSDRKQRAMNVYLPAIGMLAAVSAYFYFTGKPIEQFQQSLYVGVLLLVCFAINGYKKISLHTVVATYLSAVMLSVNLYLGMAFFVFAALIGWSRVVLGRHTREEVLLGWVIGSLFGLVHAWLF